MIKLGETDPILQRIADEMAARNAPASIAEMTPAQVRAELEARGLLDEQEPEQYRRRMDKRRNSARQWQRKRRRR